MVTITQEQKQNATNQPTASVKMQRTYLKGSSLEIPQGAQAFKQKGDVKTNLDLKDDAHWLEDDIYEVVLTLTATISNDQQKLCTAHIDYAVIAELEGFTPESRDKLLRTYMLSMMYPHAIERLNNMLISATFPAIQWTPINFEEMYQKKQAASNATQSNSAPADAVLN